jgi:hypothetical protein
LDVDEVTNQAILTKAIQKAIDGGWDVDLETVLVEMTKKWSLQGLRYTGHSGLLFSHDFAKALWGEDTYIDEGNVMAIDREGWQYHLQQMVIADDPIKYLGEHLGS